MSTKIKQVYLDFIKTKYSLILKNNKYILYSVSEDDISPLFKHYQYKEVDKFMKSMEILK